MWQVSLGLKEDEEGSQAKELVWEQETENSRKWNF